MLIMDGGQKKVKCILHQKEDKEIDEPNFAPFLSSSPKFNYRKKEKNGETIKIPRKNNVKVK